MERAATLSSACRRSLLSAGLVTEQRVLLQAVGACENLRCWLDDTRFEPETREAQGRGGRRLSSEEPQYCGIQCFEKQRFEMQYFEMQYCEMQRVSDAQQKRARALWGLEPSSLHSWPASELHRTP